MTTHKSKIIAVILGGAASVWDEYSRTTALLREAGTLTTCTYYAINDMIARFPPADYGVTLHPEKLARWMADRRERGQGAPEMPVIAHTGAEGVAVVMPLEWGSGGLFATCAALRMGARAVVLCGVGMTPEGRHFVRGQTWGDCASFLPAWRGRLPELAPYVRSWGGWTADVLGQPTTGFLADAWGRPPAVLGAARRSRTRQP